MEDVTWAVIFIRCEDNGFESVDLFELFDDAREFMLEDLGELVAAFGDGLDISDSVQELTVRFASKLLWKWSIKPARVH